MKRRQIREIPAAPAPVFPAEYPAVRVPPKKRRAAAQRTPPPNSGTEITQEDLAQLIAKAAYFRAEARGFAPGHELEDWLEAEKDVRRQIGQGTV